MALFVECMTNDCVVGLVKVDSEASPNFSRGKSRSAVRVKSMPRKPPVFPCIGHTAHEFSRTESDEPGAKGSPPSVRNYRETPRYCYRK